ncbi:MAG: biotin carboxylase N-terminal domain-containing protein [Fimbriimonadales bacterium]
MPTLPKKLLVANRAEIACRVMRTCRQLGIKTVAVYTNDDVGVSQHIEDADESVEISSYLSTEEILNAAASTKAEAIHPGYGFLAENPAFSDKCAAAGIVFIGPSGDSMRAIGDKSQARSVAKAAGVPITEGVGPFTEVPEIVEAIRQLGAPAMLKAAAGGGGKGMKLVNSFEGIEEIVASAQRETSAAFGDDRMIVERYVHPARHIEVQIMADGNRTIALGERECSLQRRHQKMIEESPAASISEELRQNLFDAARKVTEAVNYKNAGTCEFLVSDDGRFYFLEVNARLQVEHPVTELCTGFDLVRMQIELAFGAPLIQQTDVKRFGHAIEARICAEDPYNDFLPSAGKLVLKRFPTTLRVDEGITDRVSPKYDSLIAKLISFSPESREAARSNLIASLKETAIFGIATNQSYLIRLLETSEFVEGKTYTTTVDGLEIEAPTIPNEMEYAAALMLQGPRTAPHSVWTKSSDWRLK